MIRRSRVIAAVAVATLCAPGTWLRTEVDRGLPDSIDLVQIAQGTSTPEPEWRIAGIWHYSTGPSRAFGGFSALLALGEDRLRAFSDRGFRFTFTEPDSPRETPESRGVVRQLVDRENANNLWDIESATRDPATGQYWIGYEYVHTIHRFQISSETAGSRDLEDEVNWTANSGAEAMVRLSDGRFLVIAEGKREVLIFADDPVEGSEPATIPFVTPAYSYVVTDMAELPDGRVLLLMRNVAWGYPPFDSLIAIGEPPAPGQTTAWEPVVSLDFDGIIPNENYEGIAVRGREDGGSDVWVIADDNFSVMQRTLLVKLEFDPSAAKTSN